MPDQLTNIPPIKAYIIKAWNGTPGGTSGSNIILTSDNFYSPVSSEPSLGTLHLFNYNYTATTYLAVNGAAGSAAWTSADCSAMVPAGTKGILAYVISETGAAAGGQVQLEYSFSNQTGVTPTYYRNPIIRNIWIAAGATALINEAQITLHIPLTASRLFYYYRNTNINTASPAVWVVLLGYYI